MNESDRKEFAVAINGLAATFRQQPTQALLAGYWMGLADLPIEAVTEATSRAIRQCRFMPVPAELRELAGELAPEHRAVRAWEAFVRAAQIHGYYKSVHFDDPVLNATLRALNGWMGAIERLGKVGEEKWLRKEFEKTYNSLQRARLTKEERSPLIGYHEAQNRLAGYTAAIEPPVRILTGLPVDRPAIEDNQPRPRQLAAAGAE